MQYQPRVPHPSRTLLVPLMAATLGAAVATATFAVVNIDDEASVSVPTPAVQSAPPSDAVAGQRNDAGPVEGAAQQSISRAVDAQAAAVAAAQVDSTPRYDGGPVEGAAQQSISQAVDSQVAAVAAAQVDATPRYDGGPNEGSSASTIAQPAEQSAGAAPFSGTRP
jgi:hypothetical protein